MSTAKRSPPFRAEHVGSLLRPDELVQKRYAVAAGKADAEELKPIEDKSVTEVVKLQKDCGFHAVSSGEYTRYVFYSLYICITQSKHPNLSQEPTAILEKAMPGYTFWKIEE
jgi:hypothetical protein